MIANHNANHNARNAGHPFQLRRPGPLGGEPLPYVRLRYVGDDGKRRTEWALQASASTFYLLRRDGQSKRADAACMLLAAPSDLIYVRPARLDLVYETLEVIPSEPNTSKPIQWTRDHESKDGRFRVDPIYRGCTTVQGWKLHDTERGRPETFDRLRDAKEAAQWRADSVASQ